MSAGVLNVFRCNRCSTAYLNPRLTIESTIAVENESTVYELTATEIEDRIVGFRALLSGLMSFVPRHGRLLDIGCNRGWLLEAARRQGWKAIGVELSPVAAQRARDDFGLEVYGSLDDVKQLDGFDLIVAWHVLEHTHDPVGFLRDAASLLQSDGVLALQVPSFDFVEEFRARSQIYSITCAVHAFYFTEQNIRLILSRAGLAAQLVTNSPDDLMLTIISMRQPQIQQTQVPEQSRVPSPILRRVYESLRYRGPRSLVRETGQYLKWRWYLLLHRD
jgi:2-polyprenyl-3-methyl-5-hydroxy-6-metoxy-1,4-benzoquinol methylase